MAKKITKKFKALGTEVKISLVTDSAGKIIRAKRDIETVERIFSAKQEIFCRFNPESELSKLNRNLGIWRKASPDMVYLAKRALFYHRESGGLYDPRIIDVLENIGYKSKNIGNKNPESVSRKLKNFSIDLKTKQNRIFLGHRMDFSGIAKGYIIDQAAEFLRKRGWKNFFINVNGDAYAAGFDMKGEKWKLPIEGARDKNAAVYISNQAVATSGVIKKQWKHKGKNVHHLINPKNTEKFSFEIKSVLVLHKKAEWADGRAKVLVLMGAKKGLAFAKKKKLNAIFVDKRGKIIFPNQRD